MFVDYIRSAELLNAMDKGCAVNHSMAVGAQNGEVCSRIKFNNLSFQ